MNQLVAQENFSHEMIWIKFGLDNPFANQLKHSLSQNGYDLPENYLTESELEDKLWELL